jgi:hypothetical protein
LYLSLSLPTDLKKNPLKTIAPAIAEPTIFLSRVRCVNTAQSTEDRREKIQALSLAKECYSMKLDLLTNATVVDDAIRFVSDKTKEKPKSSSSSSDEDDKESKEPDYDEDKDQLEEEEHEEETQETTINQVF